MIAKSDHLDLIPPTKTDWFGDVGLIFSFDYEIWVVMCILLILHI